MGCFFLCSTPPTYGTIGQIAIPLRAPLWSTTVDRDDYGSSGSRRLGSGLVSWNPSPHWRRRPCRWTSTRRNTRNHHLRHASQTHTVWTRVSCYVNNGTIPKLQLSEWQRIWRTKYIIARKCQQTAASPRLMVSLKTWRIFTRPRNSLFIWIRNMPCRHHKTNNLHLHNQTNSNEHSPI